MTTLESQSVVTTIDDLMYEHRAEWAGAVLGDGATDLAATDDPVAALAGADAAVWLDGYTPAAREELVRAAERGTRFVVAVPADTSDGEDLVHALPAATVVPQTVASGSLIGDTAATSVDVSEPASRANAMWLLVCANVEIPDAAAQIGTRVSTRLATQVARLAEAVDALRDSNLRLARERLGQHDAAAASMISRAERAEQEVERLDTLIEHWEERFKFEQQLAIRHHDWFKAAEARLQQPHYRVADKVYGVLRRIPGLRAIVRRSRGS